MKFKKPTLFILFTVLVISFVRYWRHAYMSFDVSMYMVLAKQVLNGAVPYVDIIDINPPLIIYIHVLIVWFSEIIKAPPLELYDLTVLAANFAVAYFITRKFRDFGNSAYYIALSFLVASLHALIAFQYGQREHLFMTAFIPYFCIRWFDGEKKTVSFQLITLVTGVLAFLKPGFLIILLSFEAILFVYRRKVLIKHWLILSLPGCIYLIHFLFLPKEMSNGFWKDLVPIVLDRYWTMGLTVEVMLEFWGPTVLCYLVLASFYGFIGLKVKEERFKILIPLSLCGFVAIAAAVFQGKGWEYHLIPAQVLLFLGFPISVFALQQFFESKLKQVAAATLLTFLISQHMYVLIKKVPSTELHFIKECGNDDLREIVPQGSSVVIFSIHPCFSYPIFYERNYSPGTRYVSLFPLAFFNFTPDRLEMFKTRFPTEADLSQEEKKFVDNLKNDFKTKKPEFIIFPKNLVPEGFDPYQYAISTGVFSEANNSYNLVENKERWRVYQRRKD